MNEREATKELSKAIGLWMDLHRSMCSDPYCVEPISLLAYLAHRHGMKLKDVPEFAQHLAEYEGSCAGCEHLRN